MNWRLNLDFAKNVQPQLIRINILSDSIWLHDHLSTENLDQIFQHLPFCPLPNYSTPGYQQKKKKRQNNPEV